MKSIEMFNLLVMIEIISLEFWNIFVIEIKFSLLHCKKPRLESLIVLFMFIIIYVQ